MKTLLILVALLAAGAARAQTNAIRTYFESHKYTSDAPLLRGMSDVQGAQSLFVEVRAETLTNLRGSNTVRAVSLRGRVTNYTDTDYIDYDELNGLIHGLEFIAQANHTMTPLDNFEALYRTRSGFTVSKTSDGGNAVFIIRSGRDDAQKVQVEAYVLNDLTQALIAAKAKLDNAK
jgi:hypothetical protein